MQQLWSRKGLVKQLVLTVCRDQSFVVDTKVARSERLVSIPNLSRNFLHAWAKWRSMRIENIYVGHPLNCTPMHFLVSSPWQACMPSNEGRGPGTHRALFGACSTSCYCHDNSSFWHGSYASMALKRTNCWLIELCHMIITCKPHGVL